MAFEDNSSSGFESADDARARLRAKAAAQQNAKPNTQQTTQTVMLETEGFDNGAMPPRKPQKQNGESFGTASLVLGIVSLIGCCCLTNILAIIFGALAKSRGDTRKRTTAGIICGVISLVLSIVLGIISFTTGMYNLKQIIDDPTSIFDFNIQMNGEEFDLNDLNELEGLGDLNMYDTDEADTDEYIDFDGDYDWASPCEFSGADVGLTSYQSNLHSVQNDHELTLTMDFTNKTDTPFSFNDLISIDVLQDGAICETYSETDETAGIEASVQPGETVSVQRTFLLPNGSPSDNTVEVQFTYSNPNDTADRGIIESESRYI